MLIICLVAVLVILLPFVYIRVLNNSVNKIVIQPNYKLDTAVYWDSRYVNGWVYHPENLVSYLVDRDFISLNANDLKSWMLTKITSGTADSSIVIFAQGNAPDTVIESDSPNVILRRYLDSGGKIIWIGDVPVIYQGLPNGSYTSFYENGPENILNVSRKSWDTNAPASITSSGAKWGMRIFDSSGRGVPSEDVTTILSVDPVHQIACSWHKNFNPKYPNSGFVRYRANPEYDATNQSLNEDVYRLAIYGFAK